MKFLKSALIASLLLNALLLEAQTSYQQVKSPEAKDFSPVQQFLASPELEGRQAGTRGAALAANYIASMMQNLGLVPFHKSAATAKTVLSDYFQPFSLAVDKVESAGLLINVSRNKPLILSAGKDFSVENAHNNVSLQSGLIIAGYGITMPALKYNDYQGIAAKGKVVIILDGYPGQQDTLSPAWKNFKTTAENDDYDVEMRCREAAKQGAAAIVVLNKKYLEKIIRKTSAKTEIPKGLSYYNGSLLASSDTIVPFVPCFLLSETGSRKLAEAIGMDLPGLEKAAAEQTVYPKTKTGVCKINLKVVSDTLHLNNVIGILKGADTSKSVILGAHYDHLGIRDDGIYAGSDDNASGVAGLLALAEMWTSNGAIPPCNIMFASWTAEEMGLVGSEYFAAKLSAPEKVKFYINMDMISRSVKQDTAGRQLSVGTRTTDENIREIARKINSTLVKPFELDLWDVTGHSGSDYASFTAKNIPIMTFNTGLHDDYHTPRDIPASADLVKMGDVLQLVNGSLKTFLEAAFPK